MTCFEVKYYLKDYIDGLLPDEMRADIEYHLKNCSKCNSEIGDLNSVIEEAKSITRISEPKQKLWEEKSKDYKIEHIRGNRSSHQLSFTKKNYGAYEYPRSLAPHPKLNPHSKLIVFLIALGSLLATSLIGYMLFTKSDTAFWTVEKTAGSPFVGTGKISGTGLLSVGDWIITDDTSSAKLKLGLMGSMEVLPNSRIQLISLTSSEYRMGFYGGKIKVNTWSSPGMFVIETPTAKIVNLNGKFTADISSSGDGVINVSTGWVSLKWKNKRVLIPSGASCLTLVAKLPGIPFYNDADVQFKNDLKEIENGNNKKDFIGDLLRRSRKKDVMTLWYLIPEVSINERLKIYTFISNYYPLPSNISLKGILNGNKIMLKKWWLTFNKNNQEVKKYM